MSGTHISPPRSLSRLFLYVGISFVWCQGCDCFFFTPSHPGEGDTPGRGIPQGGGDPPGIPGLPQGGGAREPRRDTPGGDTPREDGGHPEGPWGTLQGPWGTTTGSSRGAAGDRAGTTRDILGDTPGTPWMDSCMLGGRLGGGWEHDLFFHGVPEGGSSGDLLQWKVLWVISGSLS